MCKSQGEVLESLPDTRYNSQYIRSPSCSWLLCFPVTGFGCKPFSIPVFLSSRVTVATRPTYMVLFGLCARHNATLKTRSSVSVLHLKLYPSGFFNAAGTAKPKETPMQTLQGSTKLNLSAELYQKSSVVCYNIKNRNTCFTCRSQVSLQYWEHEEEKKGKGFVNRAK